MSFDGFPIVRSDLDVDADDDTSPDSLGLEEARVENERVTLGFTA